MAIYRGPGGAGDATGDATNASALALAAKNEAQASATSAASSATAAASSATSASSSASSATTSATNASGSASTASTAATNASNSATAADTSADAAAVSASDAASSATAAASSASSASSSASTATTQASNAASSASSASTSASEAAASAASISNRVISVTDNTNAALRITQLGTGNALLVEDAANPDSTPFVIDASGNVVSGSTASIQVPYYSNGTNTTPLFQVAKAGGFISSLLGSSSSSGFGPSLSFSRSSGDSLTVPTVVSSNFDIGSLSFQGYDGANFIRGAEILAEVDGTPGTNDMPGRLVFSTTADGASTPTERMRIDSAGQVGIGGSPTAGVNLDIRKNLTNATSTYGVNVQAAVQSGVTATANLFQTYPSTAAATFTLTSLRHYDADQGTIGAGSTVTNQYGFRANSTLTGATNNYGFYGNIASGTGRYNFYAAGTANNYFAGNVGVGVTSPGYKVDVSGDVNITGNFYKNGTIFSGGAKGGGSDAVFYENDQTVSTSYTITSGKSAMSTGPISVSSGVSVTIPSGSRWVIL